jgi:hypothetical protein
MHSLSLSFTALSLSYPFLTPFLSAHSRRSSPLLTAAPDPASHPLWVDSRVLSRPARLARSSTRDPTA